ncbi:MAG: response regulator transcription factor, partial [Candidatus Latescibacteria bacterium]|nr:response regulator transcription factor [Candidatus Latescibacterota bacterium]
MRVLIAEDNLVSRLLLIANLKQWGYEVIVATNGEEALGLLEQPGAPLLAILDWTMPVMDG